MNPQPGLKFLKKFRLLQKRSKEKCRFVTINSDERCTHFALKGSHFCGRHYPWKLPALTLGLLLIIQFAVGWLFPSKEFKKLKQLHSDNRNLSNRLDAVSLALKQRTAGLSVSLSISEGSPHRVDLTNDFLLMSTGSNRITGGLFIPKQNTTSEMWLQFYLMNTSAITAELPIEVSVWLPKALKPTPDGEWVPLTSSSFYLATPHTELHDAFTYELPIALRPHWDRFTSGIKITSVAHTEGIIMVRISARNSDPVRLAFHTHFRQPGFWPQPLSTNPFIFQVGSKDDPMSAWKTGP